MPEGQPCGSRMERLSDRLQFLTVYERFGGSPQRWIEMLFYNGAVAAVGWQEL